ncbi:unnamed protein product [Dibothriocephalus latus]|uniref:Uncharacterized protein n=1 Tax=Dibothriocephalus latus TaxID=60516 RepID=A0A3P7MYT6_DIBLA|nr:unnamed protein product [Dibothriocephalus latus]
MIILRLCLFSILKDKRKDTLTLTLTITLSLHACSTISRNQGARLSTKAIASSRSTVLSARIIVVQPLHCIGNFSFIIGAARRCGGGPECDWLLIKLLELLTPAIDLSRAVSTKAVIHIANIP